MLHLPILTKLVPNNLNQKNEAIYLFIHSGLQI